jgi:hypothetical protein
MHKFWIRDFLRQVRFRIQLALASARRFGRLIVFGFELLILSRLFERHRKLATTITAALLKTKSIDIPSPELHVSRGGQNEKTWSHGFTSIYASLFLNLRNPNDFSALRHAQPAPPFRAIYLWDSAYIADVWKWWDPSVAWDTLNAVLRLRDGDRLQHYASEFAKSRFTQPPLLAWSIGRLARTVDAETRRAWFEEAYAPLRAYHLWLYMHRALPNGLFAWAHPYESGVENAPRFSSRDERRLDNTRTVAAPDLCAYVVLQCEALATMARCLGHDDHAAAYVHQAGVLRAKVNDFLWDDRRGLYFDRDVQSQRFIRTRTIASLLPLWAGIPDQQQAERLLGYVLDPEQFNTLIPLPSVALSDPQFERDMWRGPVWINTAYSVIEGLKRYGFHAAVSNLAYRLCDGVYRTFDQAGHFYEFYDPTAIGIEHLARKRGNRWKRVSLGGKPVADFVGWTGLVNTLVIETLFGAQRVSGGIAICPRFPPLAEGLEFCLALPLEGCRIDLTVLGEGAVTGEIQTPSSRRSFKAAFGELVSLDAAARGPAMMEPV